MYTTEILIGIGTSLLFNFRMTYYSKGKNHENQPTHVVEVTPRDRLVFKMFIL